MMATMAAGLPDRDTCWQAVVRRDPDFDGRFLFAVKTTGVYCRPSCAARQPRPENVRFFAQAEAARAAGFRACRRCRPDQPKAAPGADARARAWCAWIEARVQAGEPVRLPALAAHFGLSPAHLQRTFSAAVGLSPTRYAAALRRQQFRGRLLAAGSVTDAIHGAGFGSASRAYEGDALGMTPGAFRAGGRGLEVSYAVLELPELREVGSLLVAATDRGLCAVLLGAGEADLVAQLRRELPEARLQAVRPPWSRPLALWLRGLRAHLQGRPGASELPLDVRGTALRQKVWSYLRTIPRGEVRTYAEVAAAVGHPRAVRAVATACARNPLALLVPCHRVLRGDGSLGGYRWGLERKQRLLAAEAAG